MHIWWICAMHLNTSWKFRNHPTMFNKQNCIEQKEPSYLYSILTWLLLIWGNSMQGDFGRPGKEVWGTFGRAGKVVLKQPRLPICGPIYQDGGEKYPSWSPKTLPNQTLLKSRSQWPPTHSPSVPLRRSVTLRTCGESLSRKSISLLLPSKSVSFGQHLHTTSAKMFNLLFPSYCHTLVFYSGIPYPIPSSLRTL